MQLLTPMDYMCIQVANTAGRDKDTWNDRIGWVMENMEELEDMKVEDQDTFDIAVWNLKNLNEDGLVQLDATASGLQILGAVTHDIRTCEWTNLLGGKDRFDIYTELFNRMPLSQGKGIKRKDVKKAVMTAFYGSTATPREVLKEQDCINEFNQVLESHCHGPWLVRNLCLEAWNPNTEAHEWVLPDGFHSSNPVMNSEYRTFHWSRFNLSRGFDVPVCKPTKSGKSLAANVVHSLDALVLREVLRRNFYTSRFPEQQSYMGNVPEDLLERLNGYWEETGFCSARVLSYLHQYGFRALERCSAGYQQAVYELLRTLPEESIRVLTIHDCFGVKYRYGNQLRKTYNQVMSELARSNTGLHVLKQLGINLVRTDAKNLSDCICHAEYALS